MGVGVGENAAVQVMLGVRVGVLVRKALRSGARLSAIKPRQ